MMSSSENRKPRNTHPQNPAERWSNELRNRRSLRILLPLKVIMESPFSPQIQFSKDRLSAELSEGFFVKKLGRDGLGNDDDAVLDAGQPEQYRLIGKQWSLTVEERLDPGTGEKIRLAAGLTWSGPQWQQHRQAKAPVLLPVAIEPVLRMHMQPWTKLPRRLSKPEHIWRRLQEGVDVLGTGQVPAGLPEGSLLVRGTGAELTLVPVQAPPQAACDYAVLSVRESEARLAPYGRSDWRPEKGPKPFQKLDRYSFRYFPRMPLFIPPERLHPSWDGENRQSGTDLRSLQADAPDFLRRPSAREVSGLEVLDLPDQPWFEGAKRYCRNGYVAFDYNKGEQGKFIIIAGVRLRSSGSAYFHAASIRKQKSVSGKRLPGTQLNARVLQPQSGLNLGATEAELQSKWKGNGPAPDIDEVVDDLRAGYRVLNPAPEEAARGENRRKLLGTKFFCRIHSDWSRPEISELGHEPVRISWFTSNQSRLPRHVLLPVSQPSAGFQLEELTAAKTNAPLERKLELHYRFVTDFAALLQGRDTANSRQQNSEDEIRRVGVEVAGVLDRTRWEFPVTDPRIQDALVQQRPRLLVKMAGQPVAGQFVDGGPVWFWPADGSGQRLFTISAVSGDYLLLTPKLKRGTLEEDFEIGDYDCPAGIGEQAWLTRRTSFNHRHTQAQLTDLKEARLLAGSQETLADVVTKPRELEGRYESAAEVRAELARIEQRQHGMLSLNDEQREAIEKAACSPHAFYIKGPPGTGKTQTISLLAELLAARGERVLMVSAQKKPLGDLIERVADSYGVLPARIAGRSVKLPPAEKAFQWDQLQTELRQGCMKAADPDKSDPLPNKEAAARSLWLSVTECNSPDQDRKLAAIEQIADDCMREINLYVQTIGSLSNELGKFRKEVRAGEKGEHGRPDYHTGFDTLIVDEASRVNDEAFITAAIRARRWVLVGDERQLPPFVNDDDAAYLHALCALYLCNVHPALQNIWRESFAVPEGEEDPETRKRRDGALKQAVEMIQNLWFEDPERPMFDDDKVAQIAWALESQNAYGRPIDSSGSGSLHTRFVNLVKEQSRGLQGPRPAGRDAGEEEQELFEQELSGFQLQRLRNVQEAFTTFRVRSMFERGFVSAGEASGSGKDRFQSTLRTQYRMLPEIAELVNEPVYGGDYETSLPETGGSGPAPAQPLQLETFPHPVCFLDTSMIGTPVKEERKGTSWQNSAEAALIIESLRRLSREMPQGETVSVFILSPYEAQSRLLQDSIAADFGLTAENPFPAGISDMKIANVDGVQGGEADVVFLSFVRVSSAGLPSPNWAMFLQDLRRLNVAITRARRKLIFVGHGITLRNLTGVEKVSAFLAQILSEDGVASHSLPFRVDETMLQLPQNAEVKDA